VVAWLMIAALVFVFSIDSQALDDAQAGASAGAQTAQTTKTPDGERPLNTLALTPSVIMTRGLPGQSVTQTLSLTNYTSMTFSFEMIAQDVIVRDGKRVFAAAGEVPQSVAGTAIFSKPTVTIAPGQTASVDVTVTLTKGTDIRAIVAIFQGTDKLNGGKGSVGMTASLGCLITFTAPNSSEVTSAFEVTSTEVTVHPQTETQPLRVTVNLANVWNGAGDSRGSGCAAVGFGETGGQGSVCRAPAIAGRAPRICRGIWREVAIGTVPGSDLIPV
jgi:hypothetical protein